MHRTSLRSNFKSSSCRGLSGQEAGMKLDRAAKAIPALSIADQGYVMKAGCIVRSGSSKNS
jgi:hypothetical protein